MGSVYNPMGSVADLVWRQTAKQVVLLSTTKFGSFYMIYQN